jgi:hypothetical protein
MVNRLRSVVAMAGSAVAQAWGRAAADTCPVAPASRGVGRARTPKSPIRVVEGHRAPGRRPPAPASHASGQLPPIQATDRVSIPDHLDVGPCRRRPAMPQRPSRCYQSPPVVTSTPLALSATCGTISAYRHWPLSLLYPAGRRDVARKRVG